jgi:hypothetical protein
MVQQGLPMQVGILDEQSTRHACYEHRHCQPQGTDRATRRPEAHCWTKGEVVDPLKIWRDARGLLEEFKMCAEIWIAAKSFVLDLRWRRVAVAPKGDMPIRAACARPDRGRRKR